jgi:hypothetical protein
MNIAISMENITTSDLVEELTQRSDLSKEDLYDLLKHLLDFNLTLSDSLSVLEDKNYPHNPLIEIPTEELAQEFLTRDDCDQHFDPAYLNHFVEHPEKIPSHFLLLKAENLFEQEILTDLQETYNLMSK